MFEIDNPQPPFHVQRNHENRWEEDTRLVYTKLRLAKKKAKSLAKKAIMVRVVDDLGNPIILYSAGETSDQDNL